MPNYPLIKRLRNFKEGQFNLIGTVIKVQCSEQKKPTIFDNFEKFSIAEVKISILLILQ